MIDGVLVDGLFGIYIPKRFAALYGPILEGVEEDNLEILMEGPDHPEYWEVWESVLRDAVIVDRNGQRYKIEQDGDLFAVPE